MMRAEGMSGGRDVGVVINRPNADGPCLLPACGGVGTQYTPATGWAQSLVYRARVLKDQSVNGSIAVAHGGEASTSTNGFWASLNIATTERLPLLYFIEDNGYGISVPPAPDAWRQHRREPRGLRKSADPVGRRSGPGRGGGADRSGRKSVRAGSGPVLLHLRVPRLSGHSGQDTQAYKTTAEISAERAAGPPAGLAPCWCRWNGRSTWRALEPTHKQRSHGRSGGSRRVRRSTRDGYALGSRNGAPTAASNSTRRAAMRAAGVIPPEGRRAARRARASTC